jgi:hypothetical protein
VPYLDTVSVYNSERKEAALFFKNRSTDEPIIAECELQGFGK